MFLINKSLKVYQQKNSGSRFSTPRRVMAAPACPACRARSWSARRSCRSSTARPMICPTAPTDSAKSVVEQYWKLEPGWVRPGQCGCHGRGPRCFGEGLPGDAGPGAWPPGRCPDRLARALDFLQLGTVWRGRQCAVGARSRRGGLGLFGGEHLRACVEFAAGTGRKVAGLMITCPDNPTGRHSLAEEQADLARAALRGRRGLRAVRLDVSLRHR